MDETTLRMFRPRTLVRMIEDAYIAGELPFARRLLGELRRQTGDAGARELLDVFTTNTPYWELWENAPAEPEAAA
jgi:hypothetical protein